MCSSFGVLMANLRHQRGFWVFGHHAAHAARLAPSLRTSGKSIEPTNTFENSMGFLLPAEKKQLNSGGWYNFGISTGISTLDLKKHADILKQSPFWFTDLNVISGDAKGDFGARYLLQSFCFIQIHVYIRP